MIDRTEVGHVEFADGADLHAFAQTMRVLTASFAELTSASRGASKAMAGMVPEPSRTPPMWAVAPQRSKRDPRSSRRVK